MRGAGGPSSRRRRARAIATVLAALCALLLSASGAAAATDTIFGSGTPATIDSGDGHSVEVGVKFSSEVPGAVTGIRFYKATANKGTHVAGLWSEGGTLLASATFTGESESGWQKVSFPTPVQIAANTTYVAGYFAPDGHYSDTASGLSAGFSNPPLLALADSVSHNGVYVYTASSAFPTSTFNATNYWVDVEFERQTPTVPGQPTNVTATAGNGSASVSWTAPAGGGAVSKYTITPYIGSTAQPATTVSGSPPATSATVTGLTNGTSYTFTVTASNSAGSGPASEASNAVTPTTGAIAYPDLQLLMPTGDIAIVHNSTTRTLEFTHITWDAGAGPLEIRPTTTPRPASRRATRRCTRARARACGSSRQRSRSPGRWSGRRRATTTSRSTASRSTRSPPAAASARRSRSARRCSSA